MEIAIRPRLSRADVEAIVRDRLDGPADVVDHEEFTDGFFNAAHAVALADGRRLVVKVAPEPGLKLLRYEVDLMATEIEFFERAPGAGVPMPRLWHSDAAGGVMIMDRLTGHSLTEAKDQMSESGLLELRRSLGMLGARINTVEGERFGYPRSDGHTGSDRWSTSFLAIMDDILDDAVEFGTELPRPAEEIRALVADERTLLDQVRRPALIHFDLWDGNIFVERRENGWKVEGFIDGERAFYGDPLAELVSLMTFVPPEEAAAVLDGYLGRELTEDEDRRLRLYRIYLWLILAVEGAVRGYEPEQLAAQHKWATDSLAVDLKGLEA